MPAPATAPTSRERAVGLGVLTGLSGAFRKALKTKTKGAHRAGRVCSGTQSPLRSKYPHIRPAWAQPMGAAMGRFPGRNQGMALSTARARGGAFGFVASCPMEPQGERHIANRVVESHQDLHRPKAHLPVHLDRVLDRSQIECSLGVVNPGVLARVEKTARTITQHYHHYLIAYG